jgi:hypothetical protein
MLIDNAGIGEWRQFCLPLRSLTLLLEATQMRVRSRPVKGFFGSRHNFNSAMALGVLQLGLPKKSHTSAFFC